MNKETKILFSGKVPGYEETRIMLNLTMLPLRKDASIEEIERQRVEAASYAMIQMDKAYKLFKENMKKALLR